MMTLIMFRYLRVTRQQPRHTMDTILSHLATTIMYDMSPRAFLEKYLVTSPVLQVQTVHYIVQLLRIGVRKELVLKHGLK